MGNLDDDIDAGYSGQPKRRKVQVNFEISILEKFSKSEKFEEKQNQKLSIEEYANLILSSDDKLDVNLKELKPIDISDLNSRIFIS